MREKRSNWGDDIMLRVAVAGFGGFTIIKQIFDGY